MNLPQRVKQPMPVQLAWWIAQPHRYMDSAFKHYGDLFLSQIFVGPEPLVFVNHPTGIQQLLTQDRKEFAAPGEYNKIVSPLLGEHSVVLLSGDRHRRERQLLMPPFHGERMVTYGKLICDLAEQVMANLTPGQPFSARAAMQEISLQVILEVVFGLHDGDRPQEIKRTVADMLNIFRSPLTNAFILLPRLQSSWGGDKNPWVRYQATLTKLRNLLQAEIDSRRAHPDPNRSDILSLLMSAVDELGNPMSDIELQDELLTLLVAGHETTATAMAWALYWTHYLPEVRQKILQELATCDDPTNPAVIARLPYLGAVCQETLRIYPVGMLTFPRVAQQPVEMLGYQFETGTIFVGCIYLVHQREDLYPNPQQFRPERFLERKYSPFEFIPFGGGARRCIGEALALYEMKLALATILSRYELALGDRRPEQPQRRGLTLAPARGVNMVLTARKPAAKTSVTV